MHGMTRSERPTSKDGPGYVLTFYGHDSTDRRRPPSQRAFVRFNTLAGEATGTRTRVVLSPTPDWAAGGPGLSDMTREPDGYWYIVFEACNGPNARCALASTRTAVGIARSSDLVTWSVRGTPLLVDRNGLSCGWDMPSFQHMQDGRAIVTTEDPPEGTAPARWRIRPVTALSPAAGDRLATNTYLDAGKLADVCGRKRSAGHARRRQPRGLSRRRRSNLACRYKRLRRRAGIHAA